MRSRTLNLLLAAAAGAALSVGGAWALSPMSATAQAQAARPHTPFVGVWTLNAELSDKPPAPGERGGRGDGGPGGGGRRGGFGGRGGGGFGRGGGGFGRGGGGFGRGGGFGGGDQGDDRPGSGGFAQRREAMRAVFEAPRQMTITTTDSMVIITTGEGVTTRLSTDNKKIKDESTGIERKARWEGEKLITEITGAGPAKILETYSVDAATHRLTVAVAPEGGRGQRPPMNRVYDAAQQSDR